MSYWSNPVEDVFAVTLSDSTDLTVPSRALYLPVAGTVKLTTVSGNERSVALIAGWHPIRAKRIWLTGTDGGLVVCIGY